MTSGLRVRGRTADALLIAALTVTAFVVGYRDMSANFRCQNCLPDLLYPCIRQFGYTADPAALATVPAHELFWAEQQRSISCDVVQGVRLVPIGHYWNIQKYMHAAQSAVLLVTGPRFEGFWIFLGLMYAATAAASYGLFRLGMGHAVATALTLFVIFSPFHRHHLLSAAEYAKAPFVLGLVLAAGLLVVRRRTTRELLLLSMAAGVVGGVGIGFKPDVLVCSLVAAAALLLFVPAPIESGAWRRWLPAPVFLATAIVVAAPILSWHFFSPVGSLFPVQLLGGVARGHDDTHAAPSLYDYGVSFDDSWVTFQINSYGERVRGATRFTNFQEQELTDHATALVVAIDQVFPSDRVLRVFGAVFRMLDLVPFGLAASVIVLLIMFVRQPRSALFVSFVLAGFVGYVSLVFQPRHYFHLQSAPLWMIGVLIHTGVAWIWRWWSAGAWPAWPAAPLAQRRLLVPIGLAVVFVAALWSARWYQQRAVESLIAAYQRDAALLPVDHHATPSGAKVRLPPLPEQGPGVFRTTYLVVDVECLAATDVDIHRVYAEPAYFRHPYRVPCSTGPLRWTLWLPIYEYASRWRVGGLEWKPGDPIRVTGVRRVADTRTTPLLLTLVLPPDWRDQRYYHELSWRALRTEQPW